MIIASNLPPILPQVQQSKPIESESESRTDMLPNTQDNARDLARDNEIIINSEDEMNQNRVAKETRTDSESEPEWFVVCEVNGIQEKVRNVFKRPTYEQTQKGENKI